MLGSILGKVSKIDDTVMVLLVPHHLLFSLVFVYPFGLLLLKKSKSSREFSIIHAHHQATMASHPISQTGQLNMATHNSMACHQPAPIPNMEAQGAIPAKRGPEDDVQFVSVHPVKKACGSRESLPAQIQQTPDQSNAHSQGQSLEFHAHDARPSNTGVASGPQAEPPMSKRTVSFPALESYVFPPRPDSKPSRTSHNSPVLSPRQLPQPMLPSQTQNSIQPTQGCQGLVPRTQFQVPWGMSALYPQAGSMNPEAPVNRPMPLPSVQPQYIGANPAVDMDDQPLSMSMALRKPEPPQTPVQVSQPELQRMPQSGPHSQPEDQAPSNQADHDTPKALPHSSRRQERQSQVVQTPSHAHTPPPTPAAAQSQAKPPANVATDNHVTVVGPQGSTGQQALPLKGPCVICEQMRQQLVFSQANGLPIAHLPQMPHGWHGQSPVPQLHMGHTNTAYTMMPNMLQNLQQRFQPVSLGHIPMGYGMPPMPVQVQMQMQRQIPTGTEPSQGVSPQNQQGQQAQGQQPTLSQLASASQPAMMQRPIVEHQQALAPPPSPQPPQPAPAPQTSQTSQTPPAPALPEPKKHSPNLIVDIAETCEALFPWDEVAKRHGVTRVKVVETFGAVIQLPLLRCTTDKKRHGKLATSRLREYTKAKKDAEAATAASPAKPTPAVSTPPTSVAPVAQNQMTQGQAYQIPASEAQSQASQAHSMQTQVLQAQAMQAQANQMYANQGHINQNQLPPPPPEAGQVHANQDRHALPGVFEMANTVSPLGLPSNLTHGLSGHWQRQ